MQRLGDTLLDMFELTVLGERSKLSGHIKHRGDRSTLVNYMCMGPEKQQTAAWPLARIGLSCHVLACVSLPRYCSGQEGNK